MLEAFVDDPQAATNHLVLNMNVNQRREARGLASGKTTPNWIND